MLTKKYWILVGLLIAILIGGTLVYWRWTKQKSESTGSESKQTESGVIRQVIIPPSLGPKDVIESINVLPLYFESISKEEDPSLQELWERYLGIPSSGKGVIEYVVGIWANYTKRNGTEVHKISEESPFILFFHVLKYEKPKFAQEDYSKIIFNQKFRASILGSIKLQTKVGIPSSMKEELGPDIKPEQFQQYLLQSNLFIIYTFGLKEVAEDAMIRLIDQYGVK